LNPLEVIDAAINYNVVVSGTCAPSVVSANAALVIVWAPVITLQPTDIKVCIGSEASLTVKAIGAGINYQWRKGIVNLTNGGNISGATNDTLTLSYVDIADASNDYNVVITGACSATSANASIIANYAPNYESQPENQIICEGGSASFAVTATGTDITYQWRKGAIALVNGGNVFGVNSPMLTIDPVYVSDTASNYNVLITGTCNPNKSLDASLVVNTAPVILAEPISQSVCELECIVSFSVVATGTNLTYQWRRGFVNLENEANISGANSATLTLSPVTAYDSTASYYVVITGVCEPHVTSKEAILTICEPTTTELTGVENSKNVSIYPNPFSTSINIMINDASQKNNCELKLYNVFGVEVMNTSISNRLTTVNTSNLANGIYFYKVIGNNKTIQSGKIISKQ
jgi:hypothetical protein